MSSTYSMTQSLQSNIHKYYFSFFKSRYSCSMQCAMYPTSSTIQSNGSLSSDFMHFTALPHRMPKGHNGDSHEYVGAFFTLIRGHVTPQQYAITMYPIGYTTVHIAAYYNRPKSNVIYFYEKSFTIRRIFLRLLNSLFSNVSSIIV